MSKEKKSEKLKKTPAKDNKKGMPMPQDYRGKQRTTSIYFLLWTIFSTFALLVVLLFGITQQALTERSYKEQASRDVTEKGREIKDLIIAEPPLEFQGNRSYYVLFLEGVYDVRIRILNEEGDVLYPQAPPNVDTSAPEFEEQFDFTDEIAEMLKELGQSQIGVAVYEDSGEYVYGEKINLYGTEPCYLYVGTSLDLAQTAMAHMTVRTVLIAIFVLVLAFAVSSAVSGWLVRPITEMTEKAHRLASGDFTVDFHGNDYGQEMVELAETLNYARDELSKSDRMQKEIIANVSHDFKTPLTMIKAYASMIIEISGDVPEKRNKHAQVIVDEADRLASLVNDVLDLSKMRSDMATFEKEEVDMSACVRIILDRFAYLKDTKGYTFEVDVEENLFTVADERKIEQVLYNLIGNAVNYTGEDKKVYVSLKQENEGTFRFAVRDTGSGIKPEELGEIWDRYYRSGETHKRPVQGTGLGLSIVKTVLEKHNLQFGVESEVGKGSVFYVLFPILTKTE